MTAVEKALKQFETTSACSQSVAVAFSERIGMDTGDVHRSMAGFGGGMGTQQLTCGAIVGGVFAISAAFGTEDSPQPEDKQRVKARVDAYFSVLQEKLGATDCRSLLGMSLDDAGKAGLFATRCPAIVQVCTEEAAKIIEAS